MRITHRVAWGLVVVLAVVVMGGTVVVFTWAITQPWGRVRRSVPVQDGDALIWQGGIVSVWDYDYDPGGYENHIEWVSPTGKRQHLAYVGDVPAELTLLPDGRLQAQFYDEKSRRTGKLRQYVLTWRDRRSTPSRKVFAQ